MIDTLLEQFQKELELENPLPQTKPGVWEVPLDEGLAVEIAAQDKGFQLSCPLAPFTEAHGEEVVTEVMLANLFGQGTKGATLGLSGDGKQWMLIRRVEAELNYSLFHETIEDFFNTVDLWRSDLS